VAVAVKICGLKDKQGLQSAIQAGASYLGFVFVKSSKRYISFEDASLLIKELPSPATSRFCKKAGNGGIVLTALFVDPSDEEILKAVKLLNPCLGMIQLHGNETPDRVLEIKKLSSLPVMKAIAISKKEDLKNISDYESVADMILFDTKINGKTGGTGKTFNWSLIKDVKLKVPWMLAGGLNESNICDAIKITGTRIVDVSSGVETDGIKDPEKIRTLLSLFTS